MDDGTEQTTSAPLDIAPPSLPTLRDTIESQFSLEVLRKHDELRLIDQEIAKGQAMLEQLRRCQIMPYLVSSPESGRGDTSTVIQAGGSGSGPTTRSEETQGMHPTQSGVATSDGPYTRHNARFLLVQDSAFIDDAVEVSSKPPDPDGKALSPVKRKHGKAQKPQNCT